MNLEALRGQIDEIDRDLTALFLRRLAVANEIAAVKAAQGLPIFQSEREQAVLDTVCAGAPEELRPYLTQFYKTVFDLSRQRQGER